MLKIIKYMVDDYFYLCMIRGSWINRDCCRGWLISRRGIVGRGGGRRESWGGREIRRGDRRGGGEISRDRRRGWCI